VNDPQPSPYEQQAWDDLTRPRPRRAASRAAAAVNGRVGDAASRVRDAAQASVSSRPRVRRVVDAVAGAGGAVGERVPQAARSVGHHGAEAARAVAEGGARAVSRVATMALSPKRVVKAHARAGHPVTKLVDVRALDLQLVDAVKPRSLDVAYAALAAMSGGVAGAVITGSQVAVPVSGGVAAAPSAQAAGAAFLADTAAVMALSSAVVGHHALHYGYDPARAEEKVFVLSVVNWGTALTSGSKAKAFADVSRLTQALVRGAPWVDLNGFVLTAVTKRFTEVFGSRLVKQGLGKVVPVAGVVAGGSLNWLTLEQIADAADIAYRRRFLLDKYPQLEQSATEPVLGEHVVVTGEDEDVTVTDLLREAGVNVDEVDGPRSDDQD